MKNSDMKKSMFGLMVVILFSLAACEKDDDANPQPISTSVVSTMLPSGTWRVTYYYDTDHEETASFSGYAFTFANGNVVTAAKAGSTVTGTWGAGSDDSKTKLILAFAGPDSFREISDDWHVIELTNTKIKLQDVSGGNGGTDFLTFEKN